MHGNFSYFHILLLAAVSGLLSTPVLVGPLVFADERAGGPAKPNILFISVDTLRADHLGCYGYPLDVSPSVDGLALDGVRFERCYSQAPWTLPSIASVMTSKFPSELNITDEASYINPSESTLAEILKDAGYRTGAVTSNFYLDRKRKFDQGFDFFSEENIGELDTVSSDNVTKTALRFLESRGTTPFFLWVHYFDPHHEYIRHETFANRIPDVKIPAPYRFRILELRRHIRTMDAKERRAVVGAYDSEIAYTDVYIGLLLNWLRTSDLYENLLIVFLADHGEELNERGEFGHVHSFYDEVLRVPLIIKLPGSRAGVVDGRSVALHDVLPTILDVVGIDSTKFSFRGQSLVASKDKSYFDSRPIFSETAAWIRGSAVVMNRHKLIWEKHLGAYELYDLENDPAERRNLILHDEEIFHAFRKKLDEFIATADFVARRQKGITLSSKEKDALKALGYLK